MAVGTSETGDVAEMQSNTKMVIQLDWLSMRIWAYAGIRAADVRFQFRVQIRNPDEKLLIGLLLDF